MDQRQDRQNEASPRVEFNPEANNGLVLSSTPIPKELLIEIFRQVDPATLLKFQLVCQRWKDIIQEYVWRKKAELMFRQSLEPIKNLPWRVYYLICSGKLFGRNLVKNHSGATGLDENWHITQQGGSGWTVENPPVGCEPLPAAPIFDEYETCFAASNATCTKHQEIDLVAEGYDPQILDNLKPPIMIGEWHCVRWACMRGARYELFVVLLDDEGNAIDRFQFSNNIGGPYLNIWRHVSHEFKNYRSGVRKIIFEHTGEENSPWGGLHSTKIAGASVVFKVPQEPPTVTEP